MFFNKHKRTDLELVAGCIKNDRRSQEEMYRRYFNMALSVVRRYTGDEHRQLEIINNSFLRAFQKIEKFGNKGSFEGWLRRIVFHSVSDYFRSRNNQVKFLELEGSFSPSTANEGMENLLNEDLEEMIRELPEISRNVLLLFVFDGYGHKEIAERLNIAEGTSKWHLSNARKTLREKYNRLQENEKFRSQNT